MAKTQDKGRDGKKRRARQSKSGNVENSVDEPQQDGLLYFHEMLGSWRCPNGEDLLKSGRKNNPLNCIENLFSVGKLQCLECRQCIDISEACTKPGGFAVENLVPQYSA